MTASAFGCVHYQKESQEDEPVTKSPAFLALLRGVSNEKANAIMLFATKHHYISNLSCTSSVQVEKGGTKVTPHRPCHRS